MTPTLFDTVFDPNNYKELAHSVFDKISEHLSSVVINRSQKTIDWNNPQKELAFWQEFLEHGKQEDFVDQILEHTTHIHNPKYMGHQVAATAPITLLTGMLSNLLNNGMAVYEMGMSPSAIEKIVVDSICSKIGYSQNAAGLLTSGGTLANLTALLSEEKPRLSMMYGMRGKFILWESWYAKRPIIA